MLKIMAMNAAFSKIERLALKRGLRDEMLEVLLHDAMSFDGLLFPYVLEGKDIKQNKHLTPEGKKHGYATIRESITKEYEDLDKTDTFVDGILNIENILEGLVKQGRDKYSPADKTLEELRAQEARRYAQESDIDVAEKYLECCENYDVKRESWMRSIENAPFPMSLLDQNTKDKGFDLLKTSICPDQVKEHEKAMLRLEAYGVLKNTAQAIIKDPTSHAISQESRQLKPDNFAPLEPMPAITTEQ